MKSPARALANPWRIICFRRARCTSVVACDPNLLPDVVVYLAVEIGRGLARRVEELHGAVLICVVRHAPENSQEGPRPLRLPMRPAQGPQRQGHGRDYCCGPRGLARRVPGHGREARHGPRGPPLLGVPQARLALLGGFGAGERCTLRHLATPARARRRRAGRRTVGVGARGRLRVQEPDGSGDFALAGGPEGPRRWGVHHVTCTNLSSRTEASRFALDYVLRQCLS
jgi:hypothetical protein